MLTWNVSKYSLNNFCAKPISNHVLYRLSNNKKACSERKSYIKLFMGSVTFLLASYPSRLKLSVYSLILINLSK